MRVLQIHNAYRQPGGEDRVVDGEARLLRSAGHDVAQVLTRNPDRWLTAAATLAVAPWNPRTARQVRDEARRFGPDVVHVHNTWLALSPSVIWAAKSDGTPVVMTLHNYRLTCAGATLYRSRAHCQECVGTSPWPSIRHRCYRGSRVASALAAATIALHHRLGTWRDQVDMFIALSETQREVMIEAGLPEARVAIKPHSVADPGSRVSPPSASKTVLFVGRLVEEKGIELLVEAWRRAQTGDLELAIVGDGPLRASLDRRAPQNVKLLGARSPAGVRALMLMSRALVFPSLWLEPFGLVAVEAMAAGLPVLTTPGGVGRELGNTLGSEWLVASGSETAWAEALSRLRRSDKVDAAGALSRAAFEQRYQPRDNLEHLLAIYAAVLDGHPDAKHPHG